MIRIPLAASAALLALGAPALAETPAGAASQLDAFLDQMLPAEPGFAVVVVTADDILLERTDGLRRQTTGAPMTPDTPIYIASQTKAYMGLLAATLDARGVLSLDDTLADHWGDVGFPEGFDASAWTLRDLLSHQVPLNIDLITEIEAYSARIEPADYPALIEAHAVLREPGFDYDNLGYNLYGAILESATGRSWQDWLDAVIFDPLDYQHTSARTSDFSLDELAWSHIWQGDEAGWYEVRPKTDGMMQSAGGLVTSTRDMAAYLQLQLRGEGPAGSGLSADIFTTALTPYAATGMEDGRNPYEISCSGYSLGWNVCEYEGHEIHIHGGGYTGNRTMMAFSPDLGVGIAGFSNSDNQTGWYISRATINMFFMYLVEHERTEAMAELRIGHYPERIARVLEIRETREADARADERWGDWSWAPRQSERSAYAGDFSTGDPYMTVSIVETGAGLEARWGDARRRLEPAQRDLFAGVSAPFQGVEAFSFSRGPDGSVTGFDWNEYRFERKTE